MDTTRTPLAGSFRLEKVPFREDAGIVFARYALVIVLIWIGGMKFTAYEAAGIRPFVENSPLMSFVYSLWSERTFSALLGIVEIVVGLMIAARPVIPLLSAAGSALACVMFLSTLSFLFTTPGVFEASEGGFPALSVPGQFLLKDVVLLGVSILTAAEALSAWKKQKA